MKTVKVIFDNGKSLVTRINGTDKEIRGYYLNNKFNLTEYSDNGQEEPLTSGVSVEFIGGLHE